MPQTLLQSQQVTTNVTEHSSYSETCLERPLSWETTCLEWPHIPGGRFPTTVQVNLSPKTTCLDRLYCTVKQSQSFNTASTVHDSLSNKCIIGHVSILPSSSVITTGIFSSYPFSASCSHPYNRAIFFLNWVISSLGQREGSDPKWSWLVWYFWGYFVHRVRYM